MISADNASGTFPHVSELFPSTSTHVAIRTYEKLKLKVLYCSLGIYQVQPTSFRRISNVCQTGTAQHYSNQIRFPVDSLEINVTKRI
jgi:hypothetical protein